MMTEEEIRKIVELCAAVCDSRSRSLSRDNLFVAANEANKCAGTVRAEVGSILYKMLSQTDACWCCKDGYAGQYCTVCKSVKY